MTAPITNTGMMIQQLPNNAQTGAFLNVIIWGR